MAYDDALGARVRDALTATPGLSEKQMFGGLCFLVNGHMCAGIVGIVRPLKHTCDAHAYVLLRRGRACATMVAIAMVAVRVWRGVMPH